MEDTRIVIPVTARRFSPGNIRGLYDMNETTLYEFAPWVFEEEDGGKEPEKDPLKGHGGGKVPSAQPTRTIRIGRGRHCDIRLYNGTVSTEHCVVTGTPDGSWSISDRHSTNGLWVSGVRTYRAALVPGMWMSLGDVELVVIGREMELVITTTGMRSFAIRARLCIGPAPKATTELDASRKKRRFFKRWFRSDPWDW